MEIAGLMKKKKRKNYDDDTNSEITCGRILARSTGDARIRRLSACGQLGIYWPVSDFWLVLKA